MIKINLSSRQITSSIDILQNNLRIWEPEVYEAGKISDRYVRYLAFKLIALHAIFVRNFIENSELLVLCCDGASKRNLNHVIGVVIINELGFICSIAIY